MQIELMRPATWLSPLYEALVEQVCRWVDASDEFIDNFLNLDDMPE